jgi:hypothetical protein
MPIKKLESAQTACWRLLMAREETIEVIFLPNVELAYPSVVIGAQDARSQHNCMIEL